MTRNVPQFSHLLRADEKIRTEFNEQMNNSRTLRNSLVTLNTQMENAQRELMRQSGITPTDLGLENAKPTGK